MAKGKVVADKGVNGLDISKLLATLDKDTLAELARVAQEKAARAYLEEPEAIITQFPVYRKLNGKRVLDENGKPIVERYVPGILIKTARTRQDGKLAQTELRIYSVALAKAVLNENVQRVCAEFVAQQEKA
ncbi:MAG: hypothetical protein QXQ53_05685 [Candidatus Methanosuratincola sp.]